MAIRKRKSIVIKTLKCFHIPKNVPTANGYKGTPITGATKFMNQFGKNGVIRRNKM